MNISPYGIRTKKNTADFFFFFFLLFSENLQKNSKNAEK